MFGAFLTWLFSQTPGLDTSVKQGCLDCDNKILVVTQLSNVLTYKQPSLGDDAFALILLRCYCYCLALFYFCVSYRLRGELLRFRLYWIRPAQEVVQEIHIP